MAVRPSLFTRGLSGLAQSESADAASSPNVSSPAEQRDDAKRNFLKAMRPLPTQHYWNIYFSRPAKDPKKDAPLQGFTTADTTAAAAVTGPSAPTSTADYQAHLEQLDGQIQSVQDFWRYHNNTPINNIKMRESIYLFKQGFKPLWEDRRNINGGSWTFRVSKDDGKEFWKRIQLLAIGEKLESVLDKGDQLCGVGLSIRFNAHLISIWHREGDNQKSIDNILKCVLEELPPELQPRADNYFYKKHSEHNGFKVPANLQAVLDFKQRAGGQTAVKDAPKDTTGEAGKDTVNSTATDSSKSTAS